MENLLSRKRFEAYAESYATHSHHPANNLTGEFPGRKHFIDTQAEVIERLVKKGVIYRVRHETVDLIIREGPETPPRVVKSPRRLLKSLPTVMG